MSIEQPDLYDHTSPKTKAQQIRDLILAKATTKQIVEKVGTTEEYVYKERGKLRKDGLLPTHQSLTISDGINDVTLVKDQNNVERYHIEQTSSINNEEGRTGRYDIPALDKNSLMSMYTAFEDNNGPGYVTAQFGIHPEISQREYQRYLTMSSRDPFDLQSRITSGIVGAPREIQAIVDKSNDNLLTNDEIVTVNNFRMYKNADFYVKKIISDPNIQLISGLGRFVCSSCHMAQAGVIFDRITEAGSFTEKYLGIGHVCPTCKSIEDKVLAQSNQKA